MLKRLNKLIFESLIDLSKYKFSHDERGNIFCIFSIQKNYVVNAKLFNDVLTFNITDKDGNSTDLTEKQFSVKYINQYNQFKKQLSDYQNSKQYSDKEGKDSNVSEIKSFDQQLEKVNTDKSKDIEVDGTIFNFKLLDDLMIDNYCQCIFQFFDEQQNQRFGVKSLLFFKGRNSVIVKIILQNQKGETIMTMTSQDFQKKYEDISIRFKEAIVKFQDYLNNK